jgi:hypothetical protein
MLQSEFEEFLNSNKSRLEGRSDSEKIRLFIDWCNKYGLEELIIRLSSDGTRLFEVGSFLDFTTKGILICKKNWSRKFVDTGFIAGMAPLPYALLSSKLKITDITKKTLVETADIIRKKESILSKYVQYAEVAEISLRPGLETRVTNMLGSTLRQNFMFIKTKEGSQLQFSLPVGKNGPYDKIYYWLSAILPIDVSPF